VLTPYAAYLRVYEPLAAFPSPQRAHWTRYAAAPEHRAGGGVDTEHRRALAALLSTPPRAVPPHDSEEAYVLEAAGSVLVCPWDDRLRAWLALADFAVGLPRSIRDAFLPGVVVEEAGADFARWRAAHPDAMPHIRTSTWHVPVVWFVPFADEERTLRIDATSAAEGSARCLTYRTPMAQARRRVARGLRELRQAFGDQAGGAAPDELEALGRWLEEFHPRSVVELDYGGLVHLLADEALEADRSAAEVAAALGALRSGDPAAAGEIYAQMVERWRAVQLLEHAS